MKEAVVALKPATSVVAEAVTMPWVVLEKAEANARRAIAARRAGVLPPVARAARGGRGAAAHRAVAAEVAVEEVPGAAAEVVVARL